MAGSVERTSVITQIIREAKKGQLAVIWLDLANAYGTLPPQLIDVILQKYHVPDKVRKLLDHNCNNFASLLSNCGLEQHVQYPTHSKGHILVLLITTKLGPKPRILNRMTYALVIISLSVFVLI